MEKTIRKQLLLIEAFKALHLKASMRAHSLTGKSTAYVAPFAARNKEDTCAFPLPLFLLPSLPPSLSSPLPLFLPPSLPPSLPLFLPPLFPPSLPLFLPPSLPSLPPSLSFSLLILLFWKSCMNHLYFTSQAYMGRLIAIITAEAYT